MKEETGLTLETKRAENTANAIAEIKNLNEDYKKLAEEKTEELTDIVEGVKNMATAIQLPQFYVDNELNLHCVTATKLSNIALYYNGETGDLMEGVKEVE